MASTQEDKTPTMRSSDFTKKLGLRGFSSKLQRFRQGRRLLREENSRLREENARLRVEKKGKRRAGSEETFESKLASSTDDPFGKVLYCPSTLPDDQSIPKVQSIRVSKSNSDAPSQRSGSQIQKIRSTSDGIESLTGSLLSQSSTSQILKTKKKRNQFVLRPILDRPRIDTCGPAMRPISAPFDGRLFREDPSSPASDLDERGCLTPDELERALGRRGRPPCPCGLHCGDPSSSSRLSSSLQETFPSKDQQAVEVRE
jgi:hypothetical protein